LLFAADTKAPTPAPAAPITLDVSEVQPRELEDTTVKAIARDYSTAWNTLGRALAENRAELLNADFVGYAQQKFADAITQQQKSGLRTRYIDRGHKVRAIFYSPEGSSMQLEDTASLGIQLLDGDNVVSQQDVTVRYVAVMTVAEDRWKVRVLQAVPSD
jgi:hypothetical protein